MMEKHKWIITALDGLNRPQNDLFVIIYFICSFINEYKGKYPNVFAFFKQSILQSTAGQ